MKRTPKAPRDKVSAKDLQLVRDFVAGLKPEQKTRLADRLSGYEKTEAIALLLKMADRVGSTTPPIDTQHMERQGEEGKDDQIPEKKTKQKRKRSRQGEEEAEHEVKEKPRAKQKTKQSRQGEEKTEIEEVE